MTAPELDTRLGRAANTAGAAENRDKAFVLDVYGRLEAHYDIDRWHWREDTPAFDICAGAILVQHTAWAQVEKALANLRDAGRFSAGSIARTTDEELAALLRPAGMPLTKARRLKAFVALADRHGGLDQLLSLPAIDLRTMLLATRGIGPETADVILLYAAGALINVHDAYTQRLFRRLGLGPARDGYAVWSSWLVDRMPPEVRLYQRLHAAIVVHCKELCRARPRCGSCPLLGICAFGKAVSGSATPPGVDAEASRPA
jgi:endonuclease-3 related protein